MDLSVSKTLIFTATYNEKDNIAELLRDIVQHCPQSDILVVDDGSPDGTGAILDGLAKADPRINVIHRTGKLGLGTAHVAGMEFAKSKGYSQLVTMDADFSHLPGDIPGLLQALPGCDFVIGSRYMPGGYCEYRGYRKFISVAANILARLLLGIKLHEFTTSFRAFDVAFLRSVDLNTIQAKGYSFFLEVVFRLHRAGARMREVPIRFEDRKRGYSKIPKLEIFNGMAKLLRLVLVRIGF